LLWWCPRMLTAALNKHKSVLPIRTSPVCSRTICRPALPAMRFRAEVEGFAERKRRLGACRAISRGAHSRHPPTGRALPRGARGCLGIPSAGASRTASSRRPVHLLRATAGRRGCLGVPSAGASRTAASRRPVHLSRATEGRPGCAGEPRALGGLGGPFEAPHLNGAPRLRRPDPGAFEDRLVASAPPTAARSRGAPRLRREPRAPGGLGGPFEAPQLKRTRVASEGIGGDHRGVTDTGEAAPAPLPRERCCRWSRLVPRRCPMRRQAPRLERPHRRSRPAAFRGEAPLQAPSPAPPGQRA
jgi:hypothetical protein